MDKRKKHFARLRGEEQRRKPPTKAKRRNQMCTYLKNMDRFTHNQLKNKSFNEVQKAFNKTMGWIDSFVSIDSEVVKGAKEKDEGSVTRAKESKEAEMKKHMEIVLDEEEIAVDAIPLATKPPIIVDWKIIKEGKMGYIQLIRANGSSRRNTRPEEAYERVLWGDLKVMFEPDIESDVWRNLQGHKKKYPLTPATITAMLNKKLQTDHWNEMCYQLLKLMTKQVKNPGREDCYDKKLHDDLGVNTAKVRVTAAKHNLLLHGIDLKLGPAVTTAPLEATHADFFGEETEVDMSNITTTYPVPSTPNTRIHKDHSLDHVISDVQSGKDDEIFISQDKYMDGILKKFGFLTVKTASTPMETSKPLMKDENAEGCLTLNVSYLHAVKRIFRYLKAYTDSDYAGASLDRKSTTRGCQFLRSRLILWQCKKQTIVANSTTKAEYVAAASCCGQNESTICIVKNLVFHKHIEIRHHFINDSNKKKLIQMIKIYTDQNAADLLTKAFDVGRFQYLIASTSANDEIQVSAVGLTYYCSIKYALMVNPTIYTSCIKQFWATAKAKTVNGEVHIQALVDGKRGDRTGDNAKTTAWNEFSSTMASVVICLATNQNFNFSKYIFDNMVKNLEGGVKFLMYPRKQEDNTEVTQPSGSTEPITDEAANAEHVPTHYNDPLFSGEDRLQLKLLELCTKLSERVLDLENTKTSQAAKITKLKERVKKLERRNKSRTPWLKRLRKVGRSAQVVSSEDEGLGAQEDASKQERKIADLDADAEEVEVEKAVSIAEVTTVSATITTVDELTLAQTLIEIKAAKPKAVTTAATTTTTTVTRPKARGVVVQEPSKFRTTTSSSQTSQLPIELKNKGPTPPLTVIYLATKIKFSYSFRPKMIEPEKPLKKKDQILIDEEIAQTLQAQLNAELEEEEKLSKQREEDANIAE
ncbi:hypothetical protein Tco_1245498 [Tanacetum coccineum]